MTTPDPIRAALAAKLEFAASNAEGCLYSQRGMLREAAAIVRSAPPSPGANIREKLAETVHRARWPLDHAMEVTPFAVECSHGKEYVYRITDALLSSGLVAPAQEGWNEAIERCADIAKTLQRGGSFSDEYEDGFDKACERIEAKIRSLHRGAKESDGGTELNLKPGWLAKDVQKASEQVGEWSKPSALAEQEEKNG